MNSVILNKTYTELPFCEKEILRYAGCKEANSEIAALVKSCIDETKDKLIYKVCYRKFEVKICDDSCDFGAFTLQSKNLALNLNGCKSAILFAATVGVEIDRLIAKYGRISPSKALMFQAIGAERIETLCDTFCADIEETIKQLRSQAPWCKTVIDGAVLTQEYADKIGADKYAKDAMEGVRYAEAIINGGKE